MLNRSSSRQEPISSETNVSSETDAQIDLGAANHINMPGLTNLSEMASTYKNSPTEGKSVATPGQETGDDGYYLGMGS